MDNIRNYYERQKTSNDYINFQLPFHMLQNYFYVFHPIAQHDRCTGLFDVDAFFDQVFPKDYHKIIEFHNNMHHHDQGEQNKYNIAARTYRRLKEQYNNQNNPNPIYLNSTNIKNVKIENIYFHNALIGFSDNVEQIYNSPDFNMEYILKGTQGLN